MVLDYWAARLQPFRVLIVSGRVPAASPDTRHRCHHAAAAGAVAAPTYCCWTLEVGVAGEAVAEKVQSDSLPDVSI